MINTVAASNVARSEELRLALVMNGGVSLAVWMGGVSYELNRFVGESHPVYRGLLELTRTRARIDVISGTSAGGINGAALALATVYDTSLHPLRDIWLARAAFGALLREPGRKDPPSLLDGDGYFTPLLREAFGKLVRKAPRAARSAPMELSLTATLLRGEPNSRLDDLGQLIEDATHRGHFHFSRAHCDPFADSLRAADTLARAARASASFPVAFEPVLAQAGDIHVGARKASFAHYLVDGGVLDNKPIEGALRSIFRMPADGNVRRVLAYVVPDPSGSAERRDDGPDDAPMLAHVALSSLVSIPGVESIADQLDEIDAHNDQVRHNRNLPAILAATLTPAGLEQLKLTLFEAYRARRISGALDYVLEAIAACVSEMPPAAGRITFGRATRDWLKAVWTEMASSDGDAAPWRDFIPAAANAWSFHLDQPSGFTWGQYAVEFVANVVLDLLRRTQGLQHLVVTPSAAVAAPLPVTAADAATHWQEAAAGDWDALDRWIRDARARRNEAEAAPEANPEPLAGLWRRLFATMEALREARASGGERLREEAAALLAALDEAEGGTAQEEVARNWLRQQWLASPSRAQANERTARYARELAAIVVDLHEVMAGVVDPGIDARGVRPEDETARRDLGHLFAYLYERSAATDALPDIDEVMRRLLAFEVIQYTLARRRRGLDAFVQLVQISARQASPFGGGETPQTRLAGMQLAHFGAFYRKAWRANDWMMGRLDGIGRIVHVALNPERLHRLYAGRMVQTPAKTLSSRDYVLQIVEMLAVEGAERSHRALLEKYWRGARDAVWNELAFLDSPRARVPETLAASCEALTRRLHLEVLCREIPQLAAAVLDDIDAGAAASSEGTRLAAQVAFATGRSHQSLAQRAARTLRPGRGAQPPSKPVSSTTLAPEEAVRLLDTYRIGSESLADEVGTDLMLRTGSHSLAVAHAAASGKRSGLKPIAGLLNLFHWPVRAFHLFARQLLQESRTSAGITVSMLVAGMLCVLAAQMWDDVPAGVGAAGWAMLFAWLLTAYLRRTWVFALGIVAIGALYFAVAGQGAIGGIVVLAVVFLALPMPAWLTAPLIALAGAWWLTGAPAWFDVASALCALRGIDSCPVAGEAARATGFVAALQALLLVFAFAALAWGVDRRR